MRCLSNASTRGVFTYVHLLRTEHREDETVDDRKKLFLRNIQNFLYSMAEQKDHMSRVLKRSNWIGTDDDSFWFLLFIFATSEIMWILYVSSNNLGFWSDFNFHYYLSFSLVLLEFSNVF